MANKNTSNDDTKAFTDWFKKLPVTLTKSVTKAIYRDIFDNAFASGYARGLKAGHAGSEELGYSQGHVDAREGKPNKYGMGRRKR